MFITSTSTGPGTTQNFGESEKSGSTSELWQKITSTSPDRPEPPVLLPIKNTPKTSSFSFLNKLKKSKSDANKKTNEKVEAEEAGRRPPAPKRSQSTQDEPKSPKVKPKAPPIPKKRSTKGNVTEDKQTTLDQPPTEYHVPEIPSRPVRQLPQPPSSPYLEAARQQNVEEGKIKPKPIQRVPPMQQQPQPQQQQASGETVYAKFSEIPKDITNFTTSQVIGLYKSPKKSTFNNYLLSCKHASLSFADIQLSPCDAA